MASPHIRIKELPQPESVKVLSPLQRKGLAAWQAEASQVQQIQARLEAERKAFWQEAGLDPQKNYRIADSGEVHEVE